MRSIFYALIGQVMFSFVGIGVDSANSAVENSIIDAQNFHGQASQDVFVYTLLYDVLKKKDIGTYLEIGAAEPVYLSNSYFFEKLGWVGLSLEIVPNFAQAWRAIRTNPLLIEDATQSDYRLLLSPMPEMIDYLSLDTDGAYEQILEAIPLDTYTFKVITIEHDYYRFGDLYRKKEREILANSGYQLLCPDVTHPAVGSFEDWWIHPSAFPQSVLDKLETLDLTFKDHELIVKTIKAAFSE